MAGMRDIKRRIRSIGSTRKITRAMQMVSAAKMRKAQNATMASRTYSQLAWLLIQNVAKESSMRHPLLAAHPESETVGVIFLSTNRGMIGSLNVNLAAKLAKYAKNENVKLEAVNYGKKGQLMLSRMHVNILADFEKMERTLTVEDIYPLAEFVTEQYATGKYKKIVIAYNHFKSTLVQEPTIRELLPFNSEAVAQAPRSGSEDPSGSRMTGLLDETEDDQENSDEQGDLSPEALAKGEALRYAEMDSDYIFEPTPNDVISHLIPRIVESQIYQAILESEASEHSARMVMMKNATEAAGDIIADLTLTYNGLRQNKITTELAEITAGKIALE